MEGLLQLQPQGTAALLLRPPRLRRGRNHLRARARVRGGGVRPLTVNIDDLRLATSDHAVVNGRTTAAAVAPEGNKTAAEKLRLVADAAADRAEMHDIIGRQRDNWSHLLLHSTNSLTLAASAMAALAPTTATMPALKASAGVLLATAAVTMAAVNKIQPSQLAEEQRNATRLWRQLERHLRASLAGVVVTDADVQDAMDRVLALDAAYPLPLFPGMLEKFPDTLVPTRWWPKRQHLKNRSPSPAAQPKVINGAARRVAAGNGWTPEVEDEMRGIVRVLKAKDEQEYVKVGNLVLTVNRILAMAGPALAGTAAVAAAFAGGEASWATGAAVLCGALAAAVNTVEHGGQMGMLFELCRNVSGFYRKVQEDIEACLEEVDVERRENGEVFEMKVALLLGRSSSELRQFKEMASPEVRDEDIKNFAGKLF
ncbi:hypothetical protein HU200_050491 [Digitaria exilis]|uniref:F-box protein n=1 Tax=Digitaria exilis TaxID=1010633 RepID=A0A835AUG0_9POAL|nr:hypothetical protein HU200_050491 [Digitaria exilis]CAB3446159.1 unnamed protein product [Digitaria exilis]